MPLGLMLWGLILATLFSRQPETAVYVLGEVTFYVTCYVLLVSTLQNADDVRLLTHCLIGVICVLALEGIIRFFVLRTIWRLGAGTVHTATNMGAFMFQAGVILVTSNLANNMPSRWSYRALLLLQLGILVTALIFSYSRGAWLTLLVAGLILLRDRKLLIVIGLIVALTSYPFLPQAIKNRVNSAFEFGPSSRVELVGIGNTDRPVEIKNTASLRLGNWARSLEDISKDPLLGNGVGSYHGDAKGEEAPHNAYLRLWAEGGILSLLGFLWFLAVVFRGLYVSSREVAPQERWLVRGYLGLVVTHVAYMSLGDWPYQIYFWIFTGMAAATVKVLSSHQRHETGPTSRLMIMGPAHARTLMH